MSNVSLTVPNSLKGEQGEDSESRLEISVTEDEISHVAMLNPRSLSVGGMRSSEELSSVESLLMLSSGSGDSSLVLRPRASSMSVQTASTLSSHVRQRASSTSLLPSARAAIRNAALSRCRRYSSSGSSDAKSEPPDDKGSLSYYYQRMRERNNEASKRCRLKRRMKAETLEYQSNILDMHNKRLKERISRMEGLNVILRRGVYSINNKKDSGGDGNECQCQCLKTIQDMKRVNKKSEHYVCNAQLLAGSKSCRELVAANALAISQEDVVADPTDSRQSTAATPNQMMQVVQTPPKKICPIMSTDVQQRIKTAMSIPGVSLVPTPAMKRPSLPLLAPPPPPPPPVVNHLVVEPPPTTKKKTALDVLNETIVHSLDGDYGKTGASLIKLEPNIYAIPPPQRLVLVAAASDQPLRPMVSKCQPEVQCVASSGELSGGASCFGNRVPLGQITSQKPLKRECDSPSSVSRKVKRLTSLAGERHPDSSLTNPTIFETSKVEEQRTRSAETTTTIFTKISKLNEALSAINPRYKPIGFSITSIESCSPSVLQDAVLATETAISTLMSVIAPGQEGFLWKAIKPKLDGKLLTPDCARVGNASLHE